MYKTKCVKFYIEALSSNNCWCGRTIINIYSEFTSVALLIEYAMRMRIIIL